MLKNMYPLLVVDNLTNTQEFYTQVLNFNVVFESDWYIQLENNGIQIAFMIENSQNQPGFLHKKSNGEGVVITLEFDNIDEFYKNFSKKEAIIQEIKTEEWGQRHFLIKDPSGIILDMVGYTSPEDYQN